MSEAYGSLHCDACGHTEARQILSESLIGKPCPSCGANMLTAEDYAKTVDLLAVMGAFGLVSVAHDDGLLSVQPHGKTVTVRMLK